MRLLLLGTLVMMLTGCDSGELYDISSHYKGDVIECKDIGDGLFGVRVQVENDLEMWATSQRRLDEGEKVTIRAGSLNGPRPLKDHSTGYSMVVLHEPDKPPQE